MEPSFYLQEPSAAAPDAIDSSAGAPADVTSAFLAQEASLGKQEIQPTQEHYLGGEPGAQAQGYANNAHGYANNPQVFANLPQVYPNHPQGYANSTQGLANTAPSYANPAQIGELQYAQAGNVAELFQEDPYSYGSHHAPPMRPPPGSEGPAVQAALGQDFKQPRTDFEARVRVAEKRLKEVDAQLTKVLKEKVALEKDLAKEKKDRAHFQDLDAKRAHERETTAAWESHWRAQEKALKAAVEESRRKNQAMQAKLGALEARLQAAFEEIEKLRGVAATAGEVAGRLERELEEERRAYKELEEDKAADRQMLAEGEAAGVDWSQEASRLRKELDAEKKSRAMWQNMTGQLARDLNDEKARRAKEVSSLRAEFARGANGQWLVRSEELEAELKRAAEEAAAGRAADQTKLQEALTELAAEKRQKQSWQQIAERIGKESKEGRKEVEAIQKRLQEALKSSKPPVASPVANAPPPGARRGGRSSLRGSPVPEGVEDLEREEASGGAAEGAETEEGFETRAAKVPPRKRLKSLADLGDDPPKKIWKSRRARGNKQGVLPEAGRGAGFAPGGGAEDGQNGGGVDQTGPG